MKHIKGGICAAKGFKAGGVHCGIRRNKTKKDLALIISDQKAQAAAVYTQNAVRGAPLAVTAKNIENGLASAIICNSGNANTCNANGVEIAEKMCLLVEEAAGIKAEDVIVASTGVIGVPLPIEPIASSMEALISALSYNGSGDAAQAIMTTDTILKEAAVEFELGGKTCRIGGIAKGSGMIHPNLATMLVFITTDAAFSLPLLQKALKNTIEDTFNMLSIDGDTSTNDMVCIMANGLCENDVVEEENEDYRSFIEALLAVEHELCKKIATDGEGATHLLECSVSGAKTLQDARKAAKSVVCSSLLKAAMFGADANWGRVLCALGYSGANFEPEKVNLSFSSAAGIIEVCKNGAGLPFDEGKAKTILSEKEIQIEVNLNGGEFSAKARGCDLTYDYVKINGDYRT